jgi:ATP-dependent RNA helicase DDX24/MAK5
MSTIFSETTPREDMQTFVFSATLSKDLQQNLKRRTRRPPKKGKRATALGAVFSG